MVMLAAMLVGLIIKLVFSCETVDEWNITYWVEAIALGAFGLAWIVAGKIIPIIVDEQESLKIFRQ